MDINKIIDLSGKNFLITGALGQIGSEISKTIVSLNGNVILVDLPNKNFKKLNNELSKINNTNIINLECNLANLKSRASLINKINSKNIEVNTLINNVAFTGHSKIKGFNTDFMMQKSETFQEIINLNLNVAFDLSKNLFPILKKNKDSSIINIASIYGFLGPDYNLYKKTKLFNPAAYASSKAGLIQLTKWLASTCAPDVRVNCISPGGIFNNQEKIFVKKYNKKTLLNRMAKASDISSAVVYLSTNMSSYVTGHNLIVDGGISVT